MAFTDHKDIATHVAYMNRQDGGVQDSRKIALRYNHSNNDNFKDNFCDKFFSSPSLKSNACVFICFQIFNCTN